MDDVKKRPSFLIRDILGGDGDAAEQPQQPPPQRGCRGDDVTAGTSAEAEAAAATAAFASSRHGRVGGGRRELTTGAAAAAAAAALLSASALRGSDLSRHHQQQQQHHHHQQQQQQVQLDDQWAARVAPELLFLRTFCSQAATNFTSLLAGRFHHVASLAPPSALQQLQLPPPLPQQQQQQLAAFSPLPLPSQQQQSQQQPASHVAFLPYGRPSERVTSPLAADETTKSRKCRRSRTVFTESQLLGLEKRFEAQKYLSTPDRVDLAGALGLNQLQVKTWYQNRRMKWKKEALQNGELEPQTKIKSRPRQSLSSGTDDECDEDIDAQMAVDDLRDVWK